MLLTISGNPVSQKNEKRVAYNRATGRPFILSSKNVTDWKKNAVFELQAQFKGYKITEYPIHVTLIFYYNSHRRRDLDNSAAGAMDALTQAGVIEDDNVKFVNNLSLVYGGVDKENPRTEVFLDE